MNKENIKATNKKSIKAFLEYNKRAIDEKWIFNAMITNIILFYVGCFFSEYKIINIITCSIINIGMVYIYIYFFKKIKHDYKNILLVYGIYLWELSISCNYLAFHLLIIKFKYPLILFLFLLVGSIVIIIYTYFSIKYNIKKGKYINKKDPAINITLIACFGVGLSNILYSSHNETSLNSILFVLGVCICIFGLFCASFIQIIMHYYYYKIYESL
ncbi:hypothetical protein [[Clostridium] fimetarium]|uniref:Uncharacterized protein n=1 Tax=[Clostridium] fimetarium TaxID=99656 RepID=A0A1I0QYR1_9FIRM|nr:hypothetical protein [[Clostridium] fimetarium]SEW32731.1 hypothetical protein SAMN05421659_11015 [[Clostridium] fimetarium]